jgi:DNA-binding PadR family transcriptional regulator
MAEHSRGAASGDPALLIMTSLASGPKHGYALLQDIAEFAGVRLGPGTLYGAISRLEERGLIEALAADGRRRPYRLSAAGESALELALAEWSSIAHVGLTRLKASSGGHSGTRTALA